MIHINFTSYYKEGIILSNIGLMSLPKFFLTLGIYSSLLFIFNTLMRRYLKLEKRKLFSYAHINEKHKKIDWIIRIIFLIAVIISYFSITRNSDFFGGLWYFIPWFLLVAHIVLSEVIRAFMEWKYAENPKAFIFTITQLIFTFVLLLIMVYTNFFGLLMI